MCSKVTYDPEKVNVKKIICHNGMGGCHHGPCGLLAFVDKETGRLLKVEGNPDFPSNRGRICDDRLVIGLDYPAKWLYHESQLLHPLKRVGDRGEGKWQQISYEQALDEIASKLKELKEKYGPTCLAWLEGTMRSDQYWPRSRFANLWGAPLNLGDPGTICKKCMGIMWQIMGIPMGAGPNIPASKMVIIIGENTFMSVKTMWWVIQPGSKARKNFTLVVLDPRCTETARTADHWLQIRPGTDGAMLMGWLRIQMNEGLYDKEFVEKWTNLPFLVRTDTKKMLRESDLKQGGSSEKFVAWDRNRNQIGIWDRVDFDYDQKDLQPALTGSYPVTMADGKKVECKPAWQLLLECVNPYTPEEVEKITWIPAGKVAEIGRMWWTHRPSSVIKGVSTDQVGKNAPGFWISLLTMIAISGQLGRVDGYRLSRPGPVLNGNMIMREAQLEMQEVIKPGQGEMALGADHYKVMTWPGWKLASKHFERMFNTPNVSCGHSVISPTPLIWRAILNEKPYPIKALITLNGNPMIWAPNTKLVHKAMTSPKLDLHVVLEHVMTPTADLADYVMPAASKSLEMPFASTWQDGGEIISAGEQALDKPLGERRSDYEFVKGIATRLGYGEYFPWENARAVMEHRMKPVGLTIPQVAERGQIGSNPPNGPALFSEIDPKTNKPKGFMSPSGRLELWSSHLEDLGYDPRPFYVEPPESPVRTPMVAREYPLILDTGGRFRPQFHSEYRQWGMGFREQNPYPQCDIHEETARPLHIFNGDWVWIETRRGRILQKARVHPGIHPRVVNVQSHWWYPELPGEEPWLHGAFLSNANVLTYEEPEALDDYVGAWTNRALLCKVYKAKPEELTFLTIGSHG